MTKILWQCRFFMPLLNEIFHSCKISLSLIENKKSARVTHPNRIKTKDVILLCDDTPFHMQKLQVVDTTLPYDLCVTNTRSLCMYQNDVLSF